jgi:hypothetical protein
VQEAHWFGFSGAVLMTAGQVDAPLACWHGNTGTVVVFCCVDTPLLGCAGVLAKTVVAGILFIDTAFGVLA